MNRTRKLMLLLSFPLFAACGGSKAIVTGDVTQVDLPTGARSGLADAVRLLERIEGIGVTFFSDADVVRHPLVAKIVRAYEARERARDEARAAEKEKEKESGEAKPPGT